MSVKKIEGFVAIVTGASRGQGAATAKLFSEEGAQVIGIDRDRAEERGAFGSHIDFRQMDVTDELAWQRLVDDVLRQHAHIDALVNNAGVVHTSSLQDLKKEDFERALAINLMGPWMGMRAVVPAMERQGHGAIVNISSTASAMVMNGLGAYAASKWALRGLGRVAALEYATKGIRVNTILPGAVNTRMGNLGNIPKDELNKLFSYVPANRIGEPDEVARASLFLVSEDSSYIYGAELAVDGGLLAGAYNENLPGGPQTSAKIWRAPD